MARYVGKSIKRREDPALLRGEGRYVDDINLPGTLHVGFVRSPYAHARILGIDTSDAERHPDTAYIMRPEEGVYLASWMKRPGLRHPPRYSLARDKARFVGEPIVAVASYDKYSLPDIIELINIDYEALGAVTDAEEAMKPTSPLLYEEWGDNIIMQSRFKSGEVEGAFRSADLVVSTRFSNQRYAPTPIEGRGVLASMDPLTGELTIWDSTQFPHVLQTYIAEVTGFPEDRIRVIAPNVGGGFGPKSSVWQEEVATIQLAMKLGRPVKWVETRREHMLVCGHERQQVHYIEAAFRKDGRLLAVRDRVICDMGAYGAFWTETQPVMVTMAAIPGPYDFSNYEYELYCVVTNKAPYSPHRGFGRPVAAFVMERLMDMAARRLGMDPAEIRSRNLVRREQMPYRNPHGIIYDSGDYPEALRRALELAGYERWRRLQEEYRRSGRYIGVGLAMYVEYTAPSSERLSKGLGWEVGGYDTATVRVEPTGKVVVLTGTASQGQAHHTVYAQIAADALGIDMDDIVVVEGDSKLCPWGLGAWASRSTVAVGGAIIRACEKVKEKALEIAAHLLEVSPRDLEMGNGRISVKGSPERGVSFRDVARIAIRDPAKLPQGMRPGLTFTETYEPTAFTTCSYAVHIAVVEVDPETGELKFLAYYVFDDSGIIVNPMTVYGQIHGATAHGIGGAIYEELYYDENGQLLTSSFMDYLVPTSLELPSEIEIGHMETPSPNPGGFKGMGEGGAIGAPPAVANAVEDALAQLGAAITDTPLKPEYVWRRAAKR